MQSFQYLLPATNVPSRISGAAKFAQARFYPVKGFTSSGTQDNNSGPIYIGINSGEQAYPTTTGSPCVIDYGASQAYYDNINNWWAVGNSGDGLYITYF